MRRLISLSLLALVLAGCGDDDEHTALGVSAASSMTEALETCGPEFGDAEGADVRLSFAGSDELAAQIRQGVKPDVYAAANTRLPDELNDEGLLGTVERTDGTQQATYNDLPLSSFSGDQSAGDINGQGLGDVWWIVDASGTPIQEQPTRLSLATTDLGDVLVDGDGMTLYMLVPDQQENGMPKIGRAHV